MLERLNATLRLELDAGRLRLLRLPRCFGVPCVLGEVTFAASPDVAPAALADAARALLAGAPRLPLTVLLADELLRMWSIAPPRGALRMADLEAAAAQRFQALYGETAACWVVAADWQAGQRFVAAAWPRALQAALGDAARAAGLAIVDVLPRLFFEWNRWCKALPRGAWFALVHDGLLTLGMPQGRRLGAVRVLALPPQADAVWLQDELAREALRQDVALPAQLGVVGAAPAGWFGVSGASVACTRLDREGADSTPREAQQPATGGGSPPRTRKSGMGLAASARAPRLGLDWLAPGRMRQLDIGFAPPSLARLLHRVTATDGMLSLAGLALCLGAAAALSQASTAHRQRDAALQPAVVAHVAPAPAVAQSQADAVNAVIARLNRPWRTLEDALAASAPADVALLSLTADTFTPTLHIEAETGDSAAMLAYVTQLRRQRQWRDVRLSQQQWRRDAAQSSLRFDLELVWADGEGRP